MFQSGSWGQTDTATHKAMALAWLKTVLAVHSEGTTDLSRKHVRTFGNNMVLLYDLQSLSATIWEITDHTRVRFPLKSSLKWTQLYSSCKTFFRAKYPKTIKLDGCKYVQLQGDKTTPKSTSVHKTTGNREEPEANENFLDGMESHYVRI